MKGIAKLNRLLGSVMDTKEDHNHVQEAKTEIFSFKQNIRCPLNETTPASQPLAGIRSGSVHAQRCDQRSALDKQDFANHLPTFEYNQNLYRIFLFVRLD